MDKKHQLSDVFEIILQYSFKYSFHETSNKKLNIKVENDNVKYKMNK